MEKKRSKFNKQLHKAVEVLKQPKYNIYKYKLTRHGQEVEFDITDAILTLKNMTEIANLTGGIISFHSGELHLSFFEFNRV